MTAAQAAVMSCNRSWIFRNDARWSPSAEITALSEQLGAPVLTTFKGKGLIGDDHPLAAGVLGRSGTPVAARVMAESDMLLVFGASFSNHTGIEKKKPIIQVDFERMQLGKFHPVELPVWSEIGAFVSAITPGLKRPAGVPDQRAELAERCWRAADRLPRWPGTIAKIADVLRSVA